MILRIAHILVAALLLATAGPVAAQDAPAPPSNLKAKDQPNDKGDAVHLEWILSADDGVIDARGRAVVMYRIQRREANEAEFRTIEEPTYGKATFVDPNAKAKESYFYRIAAVGPGGELSEWVETVAAISPRMQFFDLTKAWFGVILLIVGGAVVFYIETARRGKDLKVRTIAGLEAVTEAVGRATEMERPVLFVAGIQDINDIQTIAGITILGNVARTCAEYDAKLEMPTSRSLVMTTARETVENAFLAAGRPDAYNEDRIYYLTDEQFGYVAGVVGTMVREKPAACFYMGAFYAESLMLAETGNGIGAIQIAGTAMPSQLPFFVAACDYTLIGEEFFAASAYLSGEPHQLGSLKGQDVGKLFAGVLILLGSIVATLSVLMAGDPVAEQMQRSDPPLTAEFVTFLRNNMLGSDGIWPEFWSSPSDEGETGP